MLLPIMLCFCHNLCQFAFCVTHCSVFVGMHLLELLERVVYVHYMLGGEQYSVGMFLTQLSRLDLPTC